MLSQPGADRTEQQPPDLADPPSADDDHLGVFGQIGQRRGRLTREHFLVDAEQFGTHRGGLHDVEGVAQDVARGVLLVLEVLGRQRGLDPGLHGSTGQHVRQRQRDPPHRGIAGGPVDGDPRLGRTIDGDDDAQGGRLIGCRRLLGHRRVLLTSRRRRHHRIRFHATGARGTGEGSTVPLRRDESPVLRPLDGARSGVPATQLHHQRAMIGDRLPRCRTADGDEVRIVGEDVVELRGRRLGRKGGRRGQ